MGLIDLFITQQKMKSAGAIATQTIKVKALFRDRGTPFHASTIAKAISMEITSAALPNSISRCQKFIVPPCRMKLFDFCLGKTLTNNKIFVKQAIAMIK